MKISNDFVDGKRNIFDIDATIFSRQDGYIYFVTIKNSPTCNLVARLVG